MFDEFLKNCPMEDKLKPSKRRVKKNTAALNSLIETEEGNMTIRKLKLKPLLIVAIIIISLSLITAAAAASLHSRYSVVNFVMEGKNIEGKYYDYVDLKGFRHVSFSAVMPIYEENFAIIYDIDAPEGENVRVLTDETDPDFMNNLRLLREARKKIWDGVEPTGENPALYKLPDDRKYPEPEDFGIVLKDSEFCSYSLGYVTQYDGFDLYDGTLGGEFMHTGAAYGKPNGTSDDAAPNKCTYDWENETKTFRHSFYYYVGKE